MPYKRKPCPDCGKMMDGRSEKCRTCKPTYARTPEHCREMSQRLSGIPKPELQGKARPAHSEYMKKWWTEERRFQKKQEMMKRNPNARYHGLSCKAAARIVREVGKCERCGHDGSESRLSVHHRNRDKHDQTRTNLEVLCHRCHTREHTAAGETGWQVYHQKKNRRS